MIKLLAADIGGTHSRFGHFSLNQEGRWILEDVLWLSTKEASSFKDLLEKLKEVSFSLLPEEADLVGIAVAGPVIKDTAHPPFIPWRIELTSASKDFGIRRFFLINDFVAQAYAIISPMGQQAEIIYHAAGDVGAPVGVMGGGTGFGKAIILPSSSGRFLVFPSEGGHTCFPLVGREEFAFGEFLLKKYSSSSVTFNQVLSGGGLAALFEYLTGKQVSPEEGEKQLADHPLILQWLGRFWGRTARDFALASLLRGGIYITGGVAIRNPQLIQQKAFLEEFLSSPTMGHLLASIPVYLIKDENSGLWGVAQKAKEELLWA